MQQEEVHGAAGYGLLYVWSLPFFGLEDRVGMGT